MSVWSRVQAIVSRKEPFVADNVPGDGTTETGSTDVAEATSQREMMRLVAQLYYVR